MREILGHIIMTGIPRRKTAVIRKNEDSLFVLNYNFESTYIPEKNVIVRYLSY